MATIPAPFEKQVGEILISTDKSRLDRDFIHGELSRTYWAAGIPHEVVERSIENSLCFGAYLAGQQVGFARVVTDQATFAWLSDVIVAERERQHGIGKALVSTIITHPGLQGLRRFMLGTKDAQGLYKKFGFQIVEDTGFFMQIFNPNPYVAKLCLPKEAAGN
ncbi:MAG TPA: GNAT family N-acetyltransferase [Verrucomicrobiae bacterium]